MMDIFAMICVAGLGGLMIYYYLFKVGIDPAKKPDPYQERVKYERDGEIGVVTMARFYWTATWGDLLEVVRDGKADGLKHLIIDYGAVREYGDGCLDPLIVQEEFREIGGESISLVAVPRQLQQMWDIMDEEKLLDQIPRFKSVEEAMTQFAELPAGQGE